MAIALLCLLPEVAAAGSGCTSFRTRAGDSRIDLAPPDGFVDVCSRDAPLCKKLAAGYPPSAKTLAYFVTTEEWKQYQVGPPIGFTRYLIAQLAQGTAPSEFPDLRSHLRSSQGHVPDHTELTKVLNSAGRVPLGILEDTEDAIAFGVVMRLRGPPESGSEFFLLASTNTAFLLHGSVLSLYAFLDITASGNTDEVKALTHEWLTCLRSAN